MDLRRLEIFAKVAELRSFSRAAEALALTQPTVSEHVRALEDDLGVQLLDRLGRGAVPTRAGLLFLGYTERLLGLAREARQAITQFQGRMSGELTVGGSTIPGEYLLPALIGEFKAKYPDISISLRIGDSRDVSQWVDEGRVELGVVGARPAPRTLESRPLTSDELVVVVPSAHPWYRRATVTVADLRSEPLLVRERGSGSREALERALGHAGLNLAAFRVAGEMGSTQAIKQGVRAGIGISIISKRAVQDECRAQLLHCVAVQDLDVSRAFYLVIHRERSRSPLATAFLEFLESRFQRSEGAEMASASPTPGRAAGNPARSTIGRDGVAGPDMARARESA
jgi:DNA-binding transcriptional LysR family regulator